MEGIHDIQPGCVRCYLGAVIPWRLGKKVKSKFICVCCIMILLELTLTYLNNTIIVSVIGAWSSQRDEKIQVCEMYEDSV